MIRILSISLIFLYTVSLLAPFVPYMEYAVHKDHIMQHHCENPNTDCEGMCYLKKQVEHHQTNHPQIVQHIFQVLFLTVKDIQIDIPKVLKIVSIRFSEDLMDSPPPTLLQPPQV